MQQQSEAQPQELDNCQFCLGAKGGVRGNENNMNGVVVCDYCTCLVNKAAPQSVVLLNAATQPQEAGQAAPAVPDERAKQIIEEAMEVAGEWGDRQAIEPTPAQAAGVFLREIFRLAAAPSAPAGEKE